MAFRFAVLNVISDGITARYGTPFTPLNTSRRGTSTTTASPSHSASRSTTSHLGTELEFLIEGLFNPERFLQLQRNFTAFERCRRTDEANRQAAPVLRGHQGGWIHVAAAESNGKAGVVWHTQGSGKSMEMELYAPPRRQTTQAQEPHPHRRHRSQGTRQPALRSLQSVTAADRVTRQGNHPRTTAR